MALLGSAIGTGKRWAAVVAALGCGPELADDAGSAGTEAPPCACVVAPCDTVCEAAFAERWETYADEEACLAAPNLGGLPSAALR